ncbi:hypothetical protein UFOVP873_1 [uncultured Caudovirales phage]|uniref:Uncharacterized protein n=1 Tax=uncultured Caudovirales phage TaxID=2100421 RepID=A0A6J5P5H5_9CAUD|nr:hypothetical protein UFOVP873_1 [uncultured Caudovirales phage]
MAIKTFTTGEVLTSSDTNTYLANSGLVAVVPTSVSGSGVALANATVTITAASTASIIGCFTSTYTNYVVVYNITATSNYLRMKLRTASADVSANYGTTNAFINDNSTTLGFLNSGATSWNDTRWLISQNVQSYGTMTIFNPQLAVSTFFQNDNTAISGTNSLRLFGSGRNTGTDVCTGLTIFPDSGTFTGTITVYGYRL